MQTTAFEYFVGQALNAELGKFGGTVGPNEAATIAQRAVMIANATQTAINNATAAKHAAEIEANKKR